MYDYDSGLLTGLKLPEGLSEALLADEILERAGDNRVIVTDWDKLNMRVHNWFETHFTEFDKLLDTITVEYNPIDNYNMIEEGHDDTERLGESTETENGTTGLEETTEGSENTSTKGESTETVESSSSEDINGTVTREYTDNTEGATDSKETDDVTHNSTLTVEGNSTVTHSGTDTVKHTGTDNTTTSDDGTVTHDITDSGTDKVTHNNTLTYAGTETDTKTYTGRKDLEYNDNPAAERVTTREQIKDGKDTLTFTGRNSKETYDTYKEIDVVGSHTDTDTETQAGSKTTTRERPKELQVKSVLGKEGMIAEKKTNPTSDQGYITVRDEYSSAFNAGGLVNTGQSKTNETGNTIQTMYGTNGTQTSPYKETTTQTLPAGVESQEVEAFSDDYQSKNTKTVGEHTDTKTIDGSKTRTESGTESHTKSDGTVKTTETDAWKRVNEHTGTETDTKSYTGRTDTTKGDDTTTYGKHTVDKETRDLSGTNNRTVNLSDSTEYGHKEIAESGHTDTTEGHDVGTKTTEGTSSSKTVHNGSDSDEQHRTGSGNSSVTGNSSAGSETTRNGKRNSAGTDSREKSGTDKQTVSLKHYLTRRGNIGVTTTQQMLMSERELVKFNIYEYIAGLFEDRFTITVY